MEIATHAPLLELLNGFIVELRSAGLPVSLTENLDAVEQQEDVEAVEQEDPEEDTIQREGDPWNFLYNTKDYSRTFNYSTK